MLRVSARAVAMAVQSYPTPSLQALCRHHASAATAAPLAGPATAEPLLLQSARCGLLDRPEARAAFHHCAVGQTVARPSFWTLSWRLAVRSSSEALGPTRSATPRVPPGVGPMPASGRTGDRACPRAAHATGGGHLFRRQRCLSRSHLQVSEGHRRTARTKRRPWAHCANKKWRWVVVSGPSQGCEVWYGPRVHSTPPASCWSHFALDSPWLLYRHCPNRCPKHTGESFLRLRRDGVMHLMRTCTGRLMRSLMCRRRLRHSGLGVRG